MTETTLTFKYLSHTKQDDGSIGRYNLEVTETRNDKTATISVDSKRLASARSMKIMLLNRCMFYSVTQKKHNQVLLELFDSSDAQAESEDSR